MNLSKNKIFYYFDSDNDAQVFNNLSAIKNHIRSRFNIPKSRLNRNNNVLLDNLYKEKITNINATPWLIYEYDVIKKIETVYKLTIVVTENPNRITTTLNLVKI